MSLQSLPVAPAPAAAAPPPAKATARAAGPSDGPRFADLVGGFVDQPDAAPTDGTGASAAQPPAEPAADSETVPPPDTQPDAASAAPVVPWLVLAAPAPEPLAAPAEPPAVSPDGLGAAGVSEPSEGADAVPVATAPAALTSGEAASATAPPAAGPSGLESASIPEANEGERGPAVEPDARFAQDQARAAGHHLLREPEVTAEGRPARPPVELDREAGAAVDRAAVAAGLPQDDGEATPVAAPTAPVAQGRAEAPAPAAAAEVVARFLRRERGDAVPAGRAAAAEAVASPGRDAVPTAATPATPAAPVPAGLGGPPAQAAPAAAAEPPALEKPRQAGRESARAADSWLGAQQDMAPIARVTTASGEDVTGADRHPTGGRGTQAAVEAGLAQVRPARATAQAPAGTAMSAPVAEGLEARFQAWLAQAVAAGPAAPAVAPEAADVPGQVIKAMQLQWRDGVGEARVHLRPEHLGAVTVSLRVEQGALVASVRVESAAALEAIKARQQELQQALEAQGLQVNELEVTLDPDDRRERPGYRAPEPPRPPRRGPAGQRFEVVA